PGGYLLSGRNWYASSPTLGGLNQIEDMHYPVASMAYHQDFFVAATVNGYLIFSLDGTTWDLWHPYHSDGFNAIAYGNGRFIAVGEQGRINVITPERDRL